MDKIASGLSCITSVSFLPSTSESSTAWRQPWLGVSTAHILDPNHRLASMTADNMVTNGECVRVLTGRARATTRTRALVEAFNAMLFQLEAEGLLDKVEE